MLARPPGQYPVKPGGIGSRLPVGGHRIQPREMTQQAIDWMRELGFGSINLDLIYGLPFQTPETFNETLDTVLEIPWGNRSEERHNRCPCTVAKRNIVAGEKRLDDKHPYSGADGNADDRRFDPAQRISVDPIPRQQARCHDQRDSGDEVKTI